jgi:hypothetical protein
MQGRFSFSTSWNRSIFDKRVPMHGERREPFLVLGRQHHAATVSCLGLVWEPETLWDLLIRAFCSVRKGTAVSQANDNFFRFVC